jgi:hypothetical protein
MVGSMPIDWTTGADGLPAILGLHEHFRQARGDDAQAEIVSRSRNHTETIRDAQPGAPMNVGQRQRLGQGRYRCRDMSENHR